MCADSLGLLARCVALTVAEDFVLRQTHPFMPSNRETFACNWFPITNPLHQAVANYCVLMLTCAVDCVSGVENREQLHSQMHFTQLRLAALVYAIPMIVSVTVREEDLPSPDCA